MREDGTNVPPTRRGGSWLHNITKLDGELADEQGLTAAFAAHGGELFSYARRALGDSGLAEEAVQGTFARAWRVRDRFEPTLGGIRAWLFAIERRIIFDLARKRAVQSPHRLLHEPPPEDSEIEDAMRGWLIEEALRRLRPEHRSFMVEIYFRRRPSKEVAILLGIPEGTVRSRLFYALKALRLALDEIG